MGHVAALIVEPAWDHKPIAFSAILLPRCGKPRGATRSRRGNRAARRSNRWRPRSELRLPERLRIAEKHRRQSRSPGPAPETDEGNKAASPSAAWRPAQRKN